MIGLREIEFLGGGFNKMKVKKFAGLLLIMIICALPVISQDRVLKAVVTLQDGAEIMVKNPTIKYRLSGTYIGGNPTKTDDKICYSINIHNVSIQKVLPFVTIKSIAVNVSGDKYKSFKSMEITLKDKRVVTINYSPPEVIEISSEGEKKTYKWDMPMTCFSVMKHEKGDKYWEGQSLVGKAVIEGQEGDFRAMVHEIKRIDFE